MYIQRPFPRVFKCFLQNRFCGRICTNGRPLQKEVRDVEISSFAQKLRTFVSFTFSSKQFQRINLHYRKHLSNVISKLTRTDLYVYFSEMINRHYETEKTETLIKRTFIGRKCNIQREFMAHLGWYRTFIEQFAFSALPISISMSSLLSPPFILSNSLPGSDRSQMLLTLASLSGSCSLQPSVVLFPWYQDIF